MAVLAETDGEEGTVSLRRPLLPSARRNVLPGAGRSRGPGARPGPRRPLGGRGDGQPPGSTARATRRAIRQGVNTLCGLFFDELPPLRSAGYSCTYCRPRD